MNFSNGKIFETAIPQILVDFQIYVGIIARAQLLFQL